MLTGKPAISFVHCRASSATVQSICFVIGSLKKPLYWHVKNLIPNSDINTAVTIELCRRLPLHRDRVKSLPNSSKALPRRQLNTRSTLRSFKGSLAYLAIGKISYVLCRPQRLSNPRWPTDDHGRKDIGFPPIRVVCCERQELNAKAQEAVAGDLRIIPMGNTFIVELTYRVGREESNNPKSVSLNPNEALCCDLGIDNFAAFVSTKPGVRPFLVKGKILKSINQRYNKQVAELKSKNTMSTSE